MIRFPPAKINLGLQIVDRRSDGFHNLQTIFYQIPLRDILEILEDENLDHGTCIIKTTGLSIPEGENLCEKAYRLLHDKFYLPGVRIYLHKIIPLGAGLGGGSSNATFTLKILNEMFNLKLDFDELIKLTLLLGSDCPLFIDGKTKYAEGRGEIFHEVELNLNGLNLLLINPKIHISTKEAFSFVDFKISNSCNKIIKKNPIYWKGKLINDFEHVIFSQHQVLKEIKDKLYQMGAIYAAMSGSGSTLYALFNKPVSKEKWPYNYFVWEYKL